MCFTSKYMFVVGSANGLICIAGENNAIRLRKSRLPKAGENNIGIRLRKYGLPRLDDIWILNPVTGLSRKLPYSNPSRIEKIMLAFWCDDDVDGSVYKVAKIVSYLNGATMLEVWVSTSPDTWRVISDFEFGFHTCYRAIHVCDVLIEGPLAAAAYWIVAVHRMDMFVVSLDLKTLRLKFYPISKQQSNVLYDDIFYCKGNYVLFGGNWNGEFALISINGSGDGEYSPDVPAHVDVYYSVWTMVTDDRTGATSWMKRITFCSDSFPFNECPGILNGKLVLLSYGVVVYDIVTGMLEIVIESDSKLDTLKVVSAHGFVRSLVSIDGFGFESNDILARLIGISWPYSYPSGRVKDLSRGTSYLCV